MQKIKYKKLRSLFLISLFSLCNNVFAQNTSKLPIPTVPSPNSENFAQVSHYGVNNFLGRPNIEIPIYEIKCGDFSLPVSLRYNASGIKVNQKAGWVGLGWSISVPGVISRVVVGNAADEDYSSRGILTKFYNDVISDSVLRKNVVDQWNENASEWAVNKNIYDNIRYAARGGFHWADTDPDIFSINCLGLECKFILDENLTGTAVPYKNYKIKGTKAWVGSAMHLVKFEVLDDKGNLYEFSAYETTSNYNKYDDYFTALHWNLQKTGEGMAHAASTAWYLTKITTAEKEEINFEYAQESYTLPEELSASRGMRNVPSHPFSLGGPQNYPQYTYSAARPSVSSQRLTRISGRDFEILFGTRDRFDLPGSKALGSIEVRSKDVDGVSKLIKRFLLIYEDVVAGDPDKWGYSGDTKKLRLFLQLVQEYDDQGNAMEHYFEYYNDYKLPHHGSMELDLWGYYNHSNAYTLTPITYVYPYNSYPYKFTAFRLPENMVTNGVEYVLPGAQRYVDGVYAQSGSLKSIKYPTGGTLTFEYEPNEFYALGRNIKGGGIRLKKSTLTDPVTGKTNIREYEYTVPGNSTVSSGVLFSLPVYAYIENTHPYEYPDPNTGEWVKVHPMNYDSTQADFYRYFLTRLDLPQRAHPSLDEYEMGYRYITVKQPGNGTTIYTYTTPASAFELTDDINNGCNINESGSCDGLFSYSAVRHYRDVIYLFGFNSNPPVEPRLDLKGMGGYLLPPFSTKLNYDWNRGLLINKKNISEAGVPIDEYKYTHSLFVGPGGLRYVYGLKMADGQNWSQLSNPWGNDYGFILSISKYRHITAVDRVLTNTEHIVYSPAGSIQESKITRYNNPDLKMPTSIEYTRSNGDRITTDLKYPVDYSGGVFDEMKNRNMVNYLVEETTTKNNGAIPITAARIGYKQWPLNGNFVKQETAELKRGTGPYRLEQKVNQYGPFGNIMELTQTDGIVRSFIYDNQNRNLLAEVVKGGYNEIAYSSFEAKNFGNWSIATLFGGYDYLYEDATAPVGRYCLELNRTDGISKGGLDPSKKYILSYWKKNANVVFDVGSAYSTKTGPTINGWTFVSHVVGTSGDIGLIGTGLIDELKLYPQGALMTTYFTEPLVGIVSKTDPSGIMSYYEYDSFKRLKLVRDKDKNIIKKYDYQLRAPYNW